MEQSNIKHIERALFFFCAILHIANGIEVFLLKRKNSILVYVVFAFARIGFLFIANFLLSNTTNFLNVGNHNILLPNTMKAVLPIDQ